METPAAYIPMDRRLALAEGRSLPERTRGAALFADISGFTPLTEMLARVLGPKRGAEELTVYLNQIYDALIAEVHRFGGSVIGFSGDAITCWFDDQPAGLQRPSAIELAAARATASGLAMQGVMQQFANLAIHGGGTVSLAMKAAVATGPVRRFVIGDPNYLVMDVMAGVTLERLAAGEHHANKGEVVVDAFTAEALGERAPVREWRLEESTGARFAVVSGLKAPVAEAAWPALVPGALSDEVARSWLLAPVYRRLQSGGGQFLAELRSAVVLFLRFTGIDYDRDEAAPAKLGAFIERLEHILARYDGSLLQLTIGDKGSYLYGAFGSPIAHEDDVDRAALATLELLAIPDELNYLEPLQIGLTYGRMRVGAYGSVMSRTYGVLGDAVNLSARLMQAATPGQILVNAEAQARASDRFIWEALSPIRVKGKSEPVALYRLVRAARPRASVALEALFPLPPIGRAEVLAGLEACLSTLLTGRGQVVRLVGEAGMGKSHLAAHFVRKARGRGAVGITLSACQNLTQNIPYLPWRQIFSQLLSLAEGDESGNIARLTTVVVGKNPAWELRLPLLGDLLDLPIPDNPTTAAMEGDVRQKSLFSLLVEMTQVWSQDQPLLLLIENIQWMDEASLALTQTLARQAASAAPVMVFVTHRPPQLGGAPVLPDLGRLAHLHEFMLAEMTIDDVGALLQRRFNAPADSLLRDLVKAMGRGNPFFMGELVEAMRRGEQLLLHEAGVWSVSEALLATLQRANLIMQLEGQWQLKPGVDLRGVALDVPDSIQKLILSRLDHLPEAPKLTLKVSSVIGHHIDLALVAQIHPETRDLETLAAEAELMEVEEVIHGEAPRPKHYTFRHHTTQEVAYETLLYTQRRQLHQAVAEALAVSYPEASAQIAHHAFLGETWPLALRYNLLAGEHAKQLYANQQSIDFLQKALRSAEALPEAETVEARKRIYLGLGELLVSTGQYETAGRHLQAALTVARAQADVEAEARAFRWLGRSHELRGEFGVALSWLERGFAALAERASTEAAEMALIAGLIKIRQGQYDEALHYCERSLQVALALNDPAVRARTYNLMGIVDRRRGDSAGAIERFSQALTHYEQLQNVYGQATSHNLIANGHFMRDDWARSDRHYRQSLELFTQIGDTYNQVLVNNNLGGIALKQGRWEAALGYYQRAVRLLEQTGGSLWVLGALHMNTGHAHLRLRELAQADERLRTAQAYFEQVQQRDLLPELYGLLAEVDWSQGKLETARSHGQLALELAREMKMPREAGQALRVLGEIAAGDLAAVTDDPLEQAHAYLAEGYRTLTEAGDEYESAKVRLVQARLFAAQGQKAQAWQALAECEPVFIRLAIHLEQATIAALRQTLND